MGLYGGSPCFLVPKYFSVQFFVDLSFSSYAEKNSRRCGGFFEQPESVEFPPKYIGNDVELPRERIVL